MPTLLLSAILLVMRCAVASFTIDTLMRGGRCHRMGFGWIGGVGFGSMFASDLKEESRISTSGLL